MLILMTKKTLKLLLSISAVLLIQACSDPAENDAGKEQAAEKQTVIETKSLLQTSAPKVLESFEVGEEVFVRSLAFDKNNDSLWVGTSTGVMEISLADSQLRNTFTRKDGLANEYVFAIYIDSKGYKWFGTNAGGTSRYKDGHWDVYLVKP